MDNSGFEYFREVFGVEEQPRSKQFIEKLKTIFNPVIDLVSLTVITGLLGILYILIGIDRGYIK